MTTHTPTTSRTHGTAAVRQAAEAEVIDGGPVAAHLLLDANATEGALSTLEVRLSEGADGATPHYHTLSHELFYVAEGEIQVLAGEEIKTVGAGGAMVVPKYMVHAFGAAPGSSARLLIVLTPGTERFEYFRLLARIERGEATYQDLLDNQDTFDNHFADSPTWRQERTRARRGQ